MKRKNMLNRLCLLVFLITFYAGYSQDQIANFRNVLKENSTEIKDVIPIVNKENGNSVIFIADAKNVYGYKLNPQFQVIDKLASETKKRKYKVFLGADIHGENYRIFMSNTDKNKFTSINFSYSSKSTSHTEFKLPKYEHFIQTIAPTNKLYFLTANKVSGGIFLYSFAEDGTPERNQVELESTLIAGKAGKAVKIATLLVNADKVNKFEKDLPNSIESVSALTKMYVRENEILISLDQNKKKTQVLTIDIDSKKSSMKHIEKPLADIKSFRKKTNSFIYDKYIFQVAGNKEVFSMHILDYDSGEFIKEYAVNKDEKITFKNTPIIQEGAFYNNYRELEKTKKFLRKISSEYIGISVIKVAEDYLFTIGGYVQQHRGGGGFMMGGGFGGIPMGSVGNVSFFFNPTMFAYNSFSNTKSTRIEGVFNQNFEHSPNKEVPEHIFDKIDKHHTKSEVAKTIFPYKDYFIKGDMDPKTNTYYLTKFTK